MTSFHKEILKLLLSEVEKKLDKHPSEKWTHQDFLDIREHIFRKTGNYLGYNTLKRMWGKITSFSSPNKSSLDIMAVSLDYKSWEDFVEHHISAIKKQKRRKSGSSAKIYHLIFGVAFIILTAFIIFLINYKRDYHNINADEIIKSISDTTGNFPLNVKFIYDISEFEKDEVYFKMEDTKHYLNKDSYVFSTMKKENQNIKFFFDEPGIKILSLYINDRKIKDNHVLILSGGWKGIVFKKDIRNYHSLDSITQGGIMQFPQNTHGIKDVERVKYVYFDTLNAVGDNMEFETRFKYIPSSRKNGCNNTIISLSDRFYNNIYIQMAQPACKLYSVISLNKKKISGRTADLSFLNMDMTQWHTFYIKTEDQFATIKIDGKEVFADSYDKSIKDICSVQFLFYGNGAVDYVWMKNREGEYVMNEDFE